MPALAEKTVDRASKLAPDVAEGPSGADMEAPTEDEDLMGNAASVEAMMEAEPDEPGDDGGGILAAMMGAEEEAGGAEAPVDADPLAGMDLPSVGDGEIQGDDEEGAIIVDCHGTEVTKGAQVLFEGKVWTVLTAGVSDFDDGEFTIELRADDDDKMLNEDDAFAVVELGSGGESDDIARPLLPVGMGGGSDEAGGSTGSAPSSLMDSGALMGTVLDIKRRTHIDDVYKERGIADAEKHTGVDRFKRWAVPKKMRAKLWSDAEEEFDGLKGAEVAKQAPKYRKMMVRAVERLDDYALQVDTAHALTEAKYKQDDLSYGRALSDGDTEAVEMYQNALATLGEHRDGLAEKSPMLHGKADGTHERSQEVVRWSDEVALIEKSPAAARMRGDEIAAKADQYRGWVADAFRDRVEGKSMANDAHAITRAIRDDAIYGKRAKNYLKRKAKRGRKDVKGAKDSAAKKMEMAPRYAAGMLSGGLVGVEEREVGGGSSTKSASDYFTWKTNFEKVKAECALIEADALYGSHTGLYTTLKMLADFGIPTLQGVLRALMLWGLILGAASLGVGLTLSAAAGAILLVVTTLKAALELVLALWSAKKVEDYTDRDARKKRHAKAERWKHGKAFAADAASAAAYGSLATTAGGRTLSPDKAWTERFEDFGNSDERSDGGVSTAKARKAMGIPKEKRIGMDGVGHRTVETPKSSRFARGAAHKAVDKTLDQTAKLKEAGGRDADEERKHRTEPMIGHGQLKGLSSEDRFFSDSLLGPSPRGKAPAPPSAPAPATPEVEVAPEVEPPASEAALPAPESAPVVTSEEAPEQMSEEVAPWLRPLPDLAEAVPAPDYPAPAPPGMEAEAETPAEAAPEASAEQAAAEGSKVKRMASKVASGLAKASEKVDEAAPKSDDEEAADKAVAVAQIAEDADVVAEALP